MKQLNTTTIALTVPVTTNGPAINAENLFYVSVQAVSTGSAMGAAKLQVSNDAPVIGTQNQPVNWSDLSGATVSISAAGAVIIPKTEICYQYIRVVYTHTAGTGNLTITVKALGQ